MKTLSEWVLKLTDNGIARQLSRIINAGDTASNQFATLQNRIVRTETTLTNTGSRFSNFFSRITSGFNGLMSSAGGFLNQIPALGGAFSGLAGPIGLAVVALTAFIGIASASVSKAADLQTSVANLSAITGIVGEDLEHLSDQAKKLGGSTGLGATQVAEAYKLIASNIDIAVLGGVAGLELLTDSTITLSKASGTTLPDAANTMAGAINQFQLAATDANRVINVLAAGAKYGAAEIPDLAASLKDAGLTASSAGISIETTVAALEVMSQKMIKGGEAGTGLRNVILKLQTENIPGVNLKIDGLATTLEKLKPRMQDAAFMAKTFGAENINAAQALIGTVDQLREMEKRVTGTNIAMEQAAINDATYIAAKNRLRETVNGLLITLGEKLLPTLTLIADKITGFINWISKDGNPVIELFSAAWTLVSIPLKLAGVWISAITDALGSLMDRLSGVTNFLGRFFGVAVNIFSSLAKLVSGVMVNVATLLNPLNWFQPSKMRDAAQALKSTIVDFGGNIGEAFSTGVQDAANKSAGGAEGFVGPMPYSGNSGAAGSASGNISDGINGITGGGKSVKNITVNIQKLVESISVNSTTLKEGLGDIQRMVEEALIRAIQGSEIAISNE